MDDTLKVLTLGFFAMLTFHASLERRAARASERQVNEGFRGTGEVHSTVQSRGMFGMLANDIWSIDIYSSHQSSDRLPFYLHPKGGWKGRIRHLRLHFTDFALDGLPVDRMDADIPFVKYDLGHALYKDRLFLRGAGEGSAVVQIGESSLQAFIQKRYPRLMRNVKAQIGEHSVQLTGELMLFNGPSPFSATGKLVPRDGRFLDLSDPTFLMDGKQLTPSALQSLLKTLNPVLDSERDMKLGGFFHLTRVEAGKGVLSIIGTTTVTLDPLPAKELPQGSLNHGNQP